jgi:hypothetical protein
MGCDGHIAKCNFDWSIGHHRGIISRAGRSLLSISMSFLLSGGETKSIAGASLSQRAMWRDFLWASIPTYKSSSFVRRIVLNHFCFFDTVVIGHSFQIWVRFGYCIYSNHNR